jgi:hypothetical protein
MFYPGSGSDHCSIPDPDLGGKKAPDPGSDLFFTNFVYLSRIPDPTIAPYRIPDPGGKKAPDPGSGSAALHRAQNKTELQIKTDLLLINQ